MARPRPLRIEGAGLWYHVMCRGNGGQRVFCDAKNCESFLERLGTVAVESRMTLREIGKEMGGVSGGAVSMAYRGIASQTKRDKHLRRIVSRLS